jgi:hypothetical protein
MTWHRVSFGSLLLLALVAVLLATSAGVDSPTTPAAQVRSLHTATTAPSKAATPAVGANSPSPSAASLPLFAFYYQWFDPSSWNRAKTDYPALGRYSSDDTNVMRQQIEWAKASGITGFIVSWKSTDVNNRRLQALMGVAVAENFSLAMIYQGLDFSRKPLPAARVAADFSLFRQKFAPNPVFYRMGGKPLTIWSGTWAYSHADVAKVTGAVRSSMLVLSTEKSVAGYKRLADVTDGDAYYWSSVNPDTNTNYASKLNQMSSAIHADQKYWIAPFAAGFDARLVGGKQTVDRNDGQTLRSEYATALTSSPDALGLISWNEFSENTYVEPSKKYGNLFLRVLSDLRQTAPPTTPAAADSSDVQPVKAKASAWPNVVRLSVFLLLLVVGVAVVAHLRRRQLHRLRGQSGNVMNKPHRSLGG